MQIFALNRQNDLFNNKVSLANFPPTTSRTRPNLPPVPSVRSSVYPLVFMAFHWLFHSNVVIARCCFSSGPLSTTPTRARVHSAQTFHGGHLNALVLQVSATRCRCVSCGVYAKRTGNCKTAINQQEFIGSMDRSLNGRLTD